ncbi:Alpha/Beta hydrolase protein [Lasiosphaeria ovina]|uniref:Alpha/Beta hydrolase protein n=1 Tax=Lasiosphaeria ovina TaxID=92902 RepID=A0AAE0TUV1_9PEZI|nr:Alpha/Beta hydrolase protein [Lasiosphaeria ovina]
MAGSGSRLRSAAVIVSSLCLTLVQLPWLAALYLFPSLRPVPAWTYRQALSRSLIRSLLDFLVAIESKPPLDLKPGKDKDRFILVPPASPRLYRDILLSDPEIKPATIGGLWFPKPVQGAAPGPSTGRRRRRRHVFLYFHGGAYVLGSVRSIDVKQTSELYLRHAPAGSAVFCPEYRLAHQAGGRCPAAFQDALTAYAHLVFTLGIPPRDIVLTGDSAGGHLALALLRYLNAHQADIPEPGGVLLWSPWPNMELTVEEGARRPAMGLDIVPENMITWAYREFLPAPHANISRSNPYMSPNLLAVPTRVPIWVQWGASELLSEDIEKLVRVQREGGLQGARLGVCEVPHAPHCIVAMAGMLGWTAEAEEAVGGAMRFLDEK